MGGPLDGVRTVELSSVVMGPFATQILADNGADVLKIESLEGDIVRDIGRSRTSRRCRVMAGRNDVASNIEYRKLAPVNDRRRQISIVESRNEFRQPAGYACRVLHCQSFLSFRYGPQG